MNTMTLPRRFGAACTLVALPLALALSASAQTAVPAAPSRAVSDKPPPGATSPAAKPTQAPAPSVEEEAGTAPETSTVAPSKSAAAAAQKPTAKDVAIGTAVYDSSGQKIGEVNGVKADGGGIIEEVHVKTGGMFGLGGKVLVVPGAKIAKGGKSIQLALSSAEIGKLPVLNDKKG